MIKPAISDIWIIHYPVPNKNKNDLLRPFIIINILNNKIYGIPLTSFTTKRYRKGLGDIIYQASFLNQKSTIKPYQLIDINNSNFIKKNGFIDNDLLLKINKTIDDNIFNYLSLKNNNSIMREYVIERQNQKIENLVQQINKIKFELTIAQEQLQLIQKDKALLLQTAVKSKILCKFKKITKNEPYTTLIKYN